MTPLDMCQKVYLSACARDGVAPRKKLVSKLALESLSAKDYLLGPEDIAALSYALTVTLFCPINSGLNLFCFILVQHM